MRATMLELTNVCPSPDVVGVIGLDVQCDDRDVCLATCHAVMASLELLHSWGVRVYLLVGMSMTGSPPSVALRTLRWLH